MDTFKPMDTSDQVDTFYPKNTFAPIEKFYRMDTLTKRTQLVHLKQSAHLN